MLRCLIVSLAGLALFACSDASGPIVLLHASYDPTGDLYEEVNAAFSAAYKTPDGRRVEIGMSHGGSGKQARSVIDGLPADVVSLALARDIDLIAEQTGKAPADWASRFASNSAPYTSTIVFLVRSGNPRAIRDWDDLAREGVSVVTPNPKTSGGARWNYLAAWAFANKRFGGQTSLMQTFVRDIYRNVVKLDSGARGSTTTFSRQGLGDVLITWENEAFHLLAESGPGEFEIIYPSLSIRAEPPVAIIEANARRHGTLEVAADYLSFLYSAEGQRIIARRYFRPIYPQSADPEDLARFRSIEMVGIDDPLFGGWRTAQAKHFDRHGLFDQIYETGSGR